MKDIVSFESLIRTALEARILNLHTCIPGIVQSIDSALGTVDISIAIKRIKKDDEEFLVPVLADVPVIFSSGGGSSISHSLSVGDEGLVIFQERDFSVFEETGSISPPGVFRKHDYSDAVFFPCGVSKGKRVPIPASGIKAVGDLNIEGNLNVTGKIDATGDIVAMKGTTNISVSLHTHIDSTGNPTQPPTPAA